MDFFTYREDELFAEEVPVARIVTRYGTPCYIYSLATVMRHFNLLREAFAPCDPLICYSIKTNSNLALLRHLRRAGAGFDVVSGGELFRALRAGADPKMIVFAGVGKTDSERILDTDPCQDRRTAHAHRESDHGDGAIREGARTDSGFRG